MGDLFNGLCSKSNTGCGDLYASSLQLCTNLCTYTPGVDSTYVYGNRKPCSVLGLHCRKGLLTIACEEFGSGQLQHVYVSQCYFNMVRAWTLVLACSSLHTVRCLARRGTAHGFGTTAQLPHLLWCHQSACPRGSLTKPEKQGSCLGLCCHQKRTKCPRLLAIIQGPG